MTDKANAIRRFRVRARHEDFHHGRVMAEPSFEAAAIAYVEHLPLRADDRSEVSVIVHDVESGQEHSFVVHLDGGQPVAA